jgi:hypothetical protein
MEEVTTAVWKSWGINQKMPEIVNELKGRNRYTNTKKKGNEIIKVGDNVFIYSEIDKGNGILRFMQNIVSCGEPLLGYGTLNNLST